MITKKSRKSLNLGSLHELNHFLYLNIYQPQLGLLHNKIMEEKNTKIILESSISISYN